MASTHTLATTCLLVLACAALACSPGDGNCVDCGGCGIRGAPNAGPGISILESGKDPAGVATVEVRREKEGECRGDSAEPSWLRYAAGGVTLETRTQAGGLDTSVVMFTGGTYAWTDRDLVLTIERTEDATVTFTFTEGAQATVVLCIADATHITCTER